MKHPSNASTLVQAHDRALDWHFEDEDPRGETAETTVDGDPSAGGDLDLAADVEPAEADEVEGDRLDDADLDTEFDGDVDLSMSDVVEAIDDGDTSSVNDGSGATDSLWEDTADERDQRVREEDRDPDHREIREHVRSHNIVSDLTDRLLKLGERRTEATADEGEVLDMRNVIRQLSGDLRVEDYWRREVTRPGERIAVGLSIDLSGSMTADELDAKAAAGAFLFAVEQSGGEVVANAWKSRTGEAEMYLVTNPWEPFRWRHLDTTDAGGGTPTARGVYEAGMLLEETRLDEKLLIVVTDGRPSTKSRDIGAEKAAEETEETVTELRDRGLTVLGIGIGNVSEDQLGEIFGEEKARTAALEELPETLIECYEAHHESATAGPASGVTI